MDEDKLGVVKIDPVPNELPPVAAAYQLIVPAFAVAVNVTGPGPQPLFDVVPVIIGAAIIEIGEVDVTWAHPPDAAMVLVMV